VEEQTLLRYFDALGLETLRARTVTNQILDWIDTDDFARDYSFEGPGYRTMGLTPPNQPIRYIDELRFLPAMTDSLVARIARDFAVGSRGKLYLPTASREALLAIGLTDRQVRQLLELRDDGELNAIRLNLIVDIDSERWSEVLTLDPSSILSVTVDLYPDNDVPIRELSPSTTFEGIAVVSDEGVSGVALRPRGG